MLMVKPSKNLSKIGHAEVYFIHAISAICVIIAYPSLRDTQCIAATELVGGAGQKKPGNTKASKWMNEIKCL